MKRLASLSLLALLVSTSACKKDESEATTKAAVEPTPAAEPAEPAEPVKAEEPAKEDPSMAVGTWKLPSELEWGELAPFLKVAAVWGDSSSGAHGTMGDFLPKQESPPHTHTNAYTAVVLEGTMTNPFAGEKKPTKMGPGSVWHVPAGAPHKTACVSKEPCKFYMHQDGSFDFEPIEKLEGKRPEGVIVNTFESYKFGEMAPFLEVTQAWGDMTKGAHGVIGRFKPEAASPMHTHSNEYHGVVISGEMGNPYAGNAETPAVVAGSTWTVPAGAKHTTECKSKEPCIFYIHQASTFDFNPVEEE